MHNDSMREPLENTERYAELVMERINGSKQIPQENKRATEKRLLICQFLKFNMACGMDE